MKYQPQLCGGFVDPNEPGLLEALEATGLYVAEEKFDGIYAIVTCDAGVDLEVTSRTGKTKTGHGLVRPPVPCVLVGELAYGQQASTKAKAGRSGLLWTFDILEFEGRDMTGGPFSLRRSILKEFFRVWSGKLDTFELSEQRKTGFRAWYDEVVSRKGEGLVLKAVPGSPWQGTRVDEWVKCKKILTVDAVIIGVETSTSDSFKGLAKSLIIGQYAPDGTLVEIGRAGGLSTKLRREYMKDPPVGQVGEFKCYEVFDSGALRHPSFLRIRDDKDPRECKLP